MNRVYPSSKHDWRGASGRMLREWARGCAREGWQVTVVTSGPRALKERDGAVRVIQVKGAEKPGFLGYVLVLLKMFWVVVRLPATHLLVTMSDPPMLAVAGRMIKAIKKNKHIHWCQDVYPDLLPVVGVKLPGFVMRALGRSMRRAMSDAEKVIVIGRCMARHLSYRGVDPRQMTVIPNWADAELLQEFDEDGVSVRPVKGSRKHDEQVKTGPRFRVLYAGNIGLAHPIETILGAAEILNVEQPDIEFLFVGDGPRYDLISKIRAEKHLDNIKLLPYQPASRLRELMESGDVHLVSMKDEAAGLLVPCKLYAALAAGRPCLLVGPAHSEVAKVIEDFKAGDVIAQGDAEGLAARILTYRQDGDAWFTAHGGAAQAGQTFVPKASVNAWIERAWGVLDAKEIADAPVADSDEHLSKDIAA